MVLLERGAEIAAVREAIASGAAHRVDVVVVESPAGCGKSTFLHAALEEAAQRGAVALLLTATSTVLYERSGSRELPAVLAGARDMGRLLDGRRLLVCVDDVDTWRAEDLERVFTAVRAASPYGLALLVTQAVPYDMNASSLGPFLLRQARFRKIRLRPLSIDAMIESLARHGLEEDVLTDAARRLFEATGGNPLLMRALFEEHATARLEDGHLPLGEAAAPGGPYSLAVFSCLRRSGPGMMEAAVALAVLGSDASVELLKRMLGAETDVSHMMRVLAETGIVDGLAFRHPAAASAVIASVPPERRRHLHRRAAQLLYTGAARPIAIARHLVAAGSASEPWEVSVMRAAAADALEQDRPREAIDALNIIASAQTDERLRAMAGILVAIATARMSMPAAERFLLDAMRPDRERDPAVRRLPERVAQASGRDGAAPVVPDSAPPSAPAAFSAQAGGEADAEVWRSWVRLLLAPSAMRGLPITHQRTGGRAGVGRISDRHATRRLSPARTDAGTAWVSDFRPLNRAATANLERSLTYTPLTDATLPTVVNKIRLLIFSGHPVVAAEIARRFSKVAAERAAPGWIALFATLLADAALARGQFTEAWRHSDDALAHISVREDAVIAMRLRISLALACTALGWHEQAGELLALPQPESLQTSVDMLGYLRAQGRHLLAIGDPASALDRFNWAGALVEQWDLDRPELIAWRLDAAEAMIQLGDLPAARDLVHRQRRVHEISSRRVRGETLRLQAALTPGPRRISLLHRAVDELLASEDRYMTARALADLGTAYSAVGNTARAEAAWRRCLLFIDGSGASVPYFGKHFPAEQQAADRERVPLAAPGASAAGISAHGAGRISRSQRRVAILAARGFTNRQIADRLHLTISTVEQHLTQTYRKLGIDGRQDLRWQELECSEGS